MLQAHPVALSGIAALRSQLSAVSLSSLGTLSPTLPPFPGAFYFLLLLSAGFGFPVSEDILVIYGWITHRTDRRILLAWMFLGVVVSDFVTFSIGRRIGEATSFSTDDEPKSGSVKSPLAMINRFKSRLMAKVPIDNPVFSKLMGVIVRFSFGLRSTLMLLAGGSGRVKFFPDYFVGTCVGAIGSLAIQVGIAGRIAGHAVKAGAGL